MVVGPQENVTLAKMESGAGPELWGAARRGQAVVRCCGSPEPGVRRTEDGGRRAVVGGQASVDFGSAPRAKLARPSLAEATANPSGPAEGVRLQLAA